MQYTPYEVPDVPYIPISNQCNVRGEFLYHRTASAQAMVPYEGVIFAERCNRRVSPYGMLPLIIYMATHHIMIKELSPISIIILCICGALLGGIVCIIILFILQKIFI